MSYAEGTTVPVERSKAEIERTIAKYGAEQFITGWDNQAALIGFRMEGRMVRFKLPMPAKTTESVDSRGYNRTKTLSDDRVARETRRRWRALLLVLKAKFEAVASGITDFDSEFLGNISMRNGQTMGEWAKPQLDEMYSSGGMPLLLPGGRE